MIEAITDKIIVEKLDDGPERTTGGIFVPAHRNEGGRETVRGRVVSVGDGVVTTQLTPGCLVWFGGFVGFFVRDEGREYVALTERDVVAITREGGRDRQ